MKRLRRLDYRVTRSLVVAGATVLLAAIAVLAWARGVDPAEAVGVALYMPVFLAAILLGTTEGIAAALLVAGIYVVLRVPAIRVVGLGRLSGLLLTRGGSYLVFGAVMGWAGSKLDASLSHLERHDMVDEATRLHNARWFLEATDAEINRVQRALDPQRGFLGYGSVFSVVVASVPDAAFGGREGARLLRDVGAEMAKGLRRSDRPVHTVDSTHLFAFLLPGTGAVGAGVVEGRITERLESMLGEKAPGLSSRAITYPDEPDALIDLREQFARIDATERLPS
jgi:hypothetical protein